MEKFKIYSNDPYDFNDIEQIEQFYKLTGNSNALKQITKAEKEKIYLKIFADKKLNEVEISLIENRKNGNGKIKLPDLVLDYAECSIKDAEKFLDFSEYIQFE